MNNAIGLICIRQTWYQQRAREQPVCRHRSLLDTYVQAPISPFTAISATASSFITRAKSNLGLLLRLGEGGGQTTTIRRSRINRVQQQHHNHMAAETQRWAYDIHVIINTTPPPQRFNGLTNYNQFSAFTLRRRPLCRHMMQLMLKAVNLVSYDVARSHD